MTRGTAGTHQPTLVMIHGLIGSLRCLSPQDRLPRLSIHTPDLLGYGEFGDVGHDVLNLAAQAAHVIGYIERTPEGSVWLLGHSMGGAIAMMVADHRPDLIAGIINVEGNFTLADAFWSRSIASKSAEAWSEEYGRTRADVPAWVERCGVAPDPRVVEWATEILDNQAPGTLHAMSRSLVDTTGTPEYSDIVRRVVESDLAIHLVAGARSAKDWDVPRLVRDAARSSIEIADTGHLMMLEAPDAFCRAIEKLITSDL